MRPGKAAEIWAAQHPGFSGVLLVEKQTERWENGQLVITKTTYPYIASAGESSRIKGKKEEHPIYQRHPRPPIKTISVDGMEW